MEIPFFVLQKFSWPHFLWDVFEKEIRPRGRQVSKLQLAFLQTEDMVFFNTIMTVGQVLSLNLLFQAAAVYQALTTQCSNSRHFLRLTLLFSLLSGFEQGISQSLRHLSSLWFSTQLQISNHAAFILPKTHLFSTNATCF